MSFFPGSPEYNQGGGNLNPSPPRYYVPRGPFIPMMNPMDPVSCLRAEMQNLNLGYNQAISEMHISHHDEIVQMHRDMDTLKADHAREKEENKDVLQDCQMRLARAEKELAEMKQEIAAMKQSMHNAPLPPAVNEAIPNQAVPGQREMAIPAELMPFVEAPRNDSAMLNQAGENTAIPVVQSTNRLFLFGGLAQGDVIKDEVERKYTDSGFWQDVGKMHPDLDRTHTSAVGHENGIAFLFSGFPSQGNKNSVFRFDSRAGVLIRTLDRSLCLRAGQGDAWQQIVCPYERCLAAHARLGDNICIAGGYTAYQEVSSPSFPFPSDLRQMSVLSSVHLFDPIHERWMSLPSLSEPKIRPVLLSTSPNVIYCLGGLTSGNRHCLRSTATIERFDCRQGRWESLCHMHQRRALFDAVVSDGSILAMGGISGTISGSAKLDIDAINSMEYYDARYNGWIAMEDKSMPTNRCTFTAHILNDNELYVIGGQRTLAQQHQRRIQAVGMDKYVFEGQCWKGEWKTPQMLAGMSSRRYAHASCIL